MTTLTSTVPGAVSVLYGYLEQVATENPSLNAVALLGVPVADVSNNYLMVGDEESGALLTGYRQDWAGLPAAAERKSEEYGIPCGIRVWQGDDDPVSRIADAFTLLDGVMALLQADPQASGALTPSGSWQVTGVDIPSTGPFGGQAGWSCVITFTVSIINVRLTS